MPGPEDDHAMAAMAGALPCGVHTVHMQTLVINPKVWSPPEVGPTWLRPIGIGHTDRYPLTKADWALIRKKHRRVLKVLRYGMHGCPAWSLGTQHDIEGSPWYSTKVVCERMKCNVWELVFVVQMTKRYNDQFRKMAMRVHTKSITYFNRRYNVIRAIPSKVRLQQMVRNSLAAAMAESRMTDLAVLDAYNLGSVDDDAS